MADGLMDFQYLTKKDFCAALGVDQRTVSRWKKKGMPINTDNTYSIASCFKWRISEVRKEIKEVDENETDWVKEGQKERALISRIIRKQVEGKVINLEEVVRLWVSRAHQLRSSLFNLSRKISAKLAGVCEKTMFECDIIMKREITDMLNDYCAQARVDNIPVKFSKTDETK